MFVLEKLAHFLSTKFNKISHKLFVKATEVHTICIVKARTGTFYTSKFKITLKNLKGHEIHPNPVVHFLSNSKQKPDKISPISNT